MTPTEQAAKAAQLGGVTEFADTNPKSLDGTQVAGVASRLLKGAVKKANIEKRVSQPPKDRPPARVPTPSEQELVETGEYSARQEEAKRALSPEGRQRLEEAGGETGIAIQMPGAQIDLDQDGLDAMQPQPKPTVAEQRAELINKRGQDAIRSKKDALVPEGDAKDLLEIYSSRGVIVSSDEGIDFNFENIETTEDVTNVINATSVIYESPQEAAKRGVKTNVQTIDEAAQELADEIGFTKRILRKKVGTTLNAAEMVALREILVKSGDRVAKIAQEIVDGDNSDVKLVELRQAMGLHSALQMKAKANQTEIARALQSFKIPVGTQDMATAAAEALVDTGGRDAAIALAKGFLDIRAKSGNAAANKFVSQAAFKGLGGVYQEIYINGLLSWFPTHFKNTFSAPLFIVYDSLSDLAGASYGTLARGLSRNPDPSGIYFEDIAARHLGMIEGLKDAWMVAGKVFRTEMPTGAQKAEAASYRAISKEKIVLFGKSAEEMPFIGEFIDTLGRIVRVPGRLLQAQDEFWAAMLARGTLYEESVRQIRLSRALGKTDQEALDDGLMLMIDPNYSSEAIDHRRKYITLTKDVGISEESSSAEKLLGAATRGIQRIPLIGRYLVPFGRVPTNTALIVAQNHPILQLANPKTLADLTGKNGAKARDRAAGKLTLAIGTNAIFYNLAQNGRLTGAMPKDQSVRNQLPPGWKPWSLVFRGDNFPVDSDGDPLPLYDAKGRPNGPLEYYSYQGLEPVSAFIGIAADTIELRRRYADPAKRLNVLSAHALAVKHYFQDLPFLQGIGDVVRSLEYEDPSILFNPLNNFVGPVPLPFSAAFRNVETALDPRIKKPSEQLEYYTFDDVNRIYDEGIEAGVYDAAIDEIPYELVGTVKPKTIGNEFAGAGLNLWLNQTRNLPYFKEDEGDYETLIDVFGQEIERSVPFGVNPVQAMYNSVVPFKYSAGEKFTDTETRLMDLGMPLTNGPTSINGITLPLAMRSEVAKLAKNNEIQLQYFREDKATFESYGFKDYIEVKLIDAYFNSLPRQKKINKIKAIEKRFYEAAFLQLASEERYANVLEAIINRDTARLGE
tara:strand:- start:350 stop:3580 length:3231 start_codon:yes stop_codon:yes gene_type:complete